MRVNGEESLWTVYDRPDDYPDQVVARRSIWWPGPSTPTGDVIVGPSLDWVREQIPFGFFCLPRMPDDDPAIVEVWL